MPFLKMVASALTRGTGGSGGREGPAAQIGSGFGAWWADLLGLPPRERRIARATGLGADVGAIFRALLPTIGSVAEISGFAIVGMMTFFGGVSNAPLAVLVMVIEMTGSCALLVPAMLAIFVAYVGTGPYHLYTEQVPSRLGSPAHREEYVDRLLRSRGEPGP